jgi:hypothetical protein
MSITTIAYPVLVRGPFPLAVRAEFYSLQFLTAFLAIIFNIDYAVMQIAFRIDAEIFRLAAGHDQVNYRGIPATSPKFDFDFSKKL